MKKTFIFITSCIMKIKPFVDRVPNTMQNNNCEKATLMRCNKAN